MKSAITALLLGFSTAVDLDKLTTRITPESQRIIDSAVREVIGITSEPDFEVHHVHHHHHVSAPVVHPAAVYNPEGVVVYHPPVAAPMTHFLPVSSQPVIHTVDSVAYTARPAAIPTNSPIVQYAPHSSVIRAIADANQKSAEVTIKEQRDMADQLQKSEAQKRIVEAINRSVADEERKIIDAANKRMAEVHARKEQEANKAAKAIEEAQAAAAKKVEAIRKEEQAAIAKLVNKHAGNVVA